MKLRQVQNKNYPNHRKTQMKKRVFYVYISHGCNELHHEVRIPEQTTTTHALRIQRFVRTCPDSRHDVN